MNSKSGILLTILLTTAGCTQLESRSPEAEVRNPDACSQPPASKRIPDTCPQALVSNLPNIDLTAQTLHRFLLSEIAAQRGHFGLAVDNILDLAKATRDPRLAKRAAELAVQSQQEEQALEAARLWLELDPSATRARQTLAALLVDSGNLDEAKIYLERLLVDEKEQVGAAFLSLHQVMSHQSDKTSVLNIVMDLAKPYPQIPEAHFAVAKAALAADRQKLALREIIEAAQLRPDWEAAALLQGQILQRTGTSHTLDFFKDYLDNFPKALTVRLTNARLLVAEKRYAEAREAFEKLVAHFPQNAEVSVALGLLSMQLRDFDKAEYYLKQALAEKFQDANSLKMHLGQLYEERKQYQEALNWYSDITSGEQAFAAQLKTAAVLAKLFRVQEALDSLYRIAVNTPSHQVRLAIAQAQILRADGRHREAYELLSNLLDKLPDTPDLLYEHAMTADKLGYFDTMEQALRKLIRLKPDYSHAYNALGYTLAERGERLEEAEQFIRKALELQPGDPFILDSMGWVQYRLGAMEKAQEYLTRAYAEQPDPEIAAHLGEVLWVQGNPEEADKIWQAALEVNPDNEALLNVIRKYKP